jgi:hypothetical protein
LSITINAVAMAPTMIPVMTVANVTSIRVKPLSERSLFTGAAP